MSQQPAPPATPATRTTRLLACGIVAGPLFLAVVLLQAVARQGFDLGRHPLSLLSLGELGWIQIANFVVTGSLMVVCAVGMRRVLRPGPGGAWGPLAGRGLRGGVGDRRRVRCRPRRRLPAGRAGRGPRAAQLARHPARGRGSGWPTSPCSSAVWFSCAVRCAPVVGLGRRVRCDRGGGPSDGVVAGPGRPQRGTGAGVGNPGRLRGSVGGTAAARASGRRRALRRGGACSPAPARGVNSATPAAGTWTTGGRGGGTQGGEGRRWRQ
jgi:Protein of unknown function (DUF998)